MSSPGERDSLVYFEAAPEGLVAVDRDGLIALVNRQAESLLGRGRAELVGQHFAQAVGNSQSVAALLADLPYRPVELATTRDDGSVRVLEAITGPRIDPEGWVVVSLRDVTGPRQERSQEHRMVRAEQMSAIGQVAAGVAHELRNPLTSIKGLVQVNLREANARGLPAEDLQIIEHEVRRMERTLQTFLDFARPPRLDRRRLDLADVVERVCSLVGGRARKQAVRLQFLRPPDPVPVEGDQDQLQQLVLNLILNALDALLHGGTIEIELRPPGDAYAELIVRDTGPGIAPDILPKVFETFVSSKETGIGLGLPVSRRIAEEHGGTLSAYNLPTGGACFTLRLPAPEMQEL